MLLTFSFVAGVLYDLLKGALVVIKRIVEVLLWLLSTLVITALGIMLSFAISDLMQGRPLF